MLTSCLKLKRGGRGRPFGNRTLGSRSSSKNGCAHASSWTKIGQVKSKGNQVNLLCFQYIVNCFGMKSWGKDLLQSYENLGSIEAGVK